MRGFYTLKVKIKLDHLKSLRNPFITKAIIHNIFTMGYLKTSLYRNMRQGIKMKFDNLF